MQMTRSIALTGFAMAFAMAAGCAGIGNDVGTRPGDTDAAVGDRGPRRTGTATSDAPSVEDSKDARIHSPTP